MKKREIQNKDPQKKPSEIQNKIIMYQPATL